MNPYMLEAATTSSTSPEAPIMPGLWRVTLWGVGLIAAIGLTASVLATAMMWLLMSNPVTVATGISTGDVEPLLRVIGAAIFAILRVVVGYL